MVAADTKKGEVWVLSIEGGGIRGIIPAQVLRYLEVELLKVLRTRFLARIKNALGCPAPYNFPIILDASLAKVFDLMVGTSVGGILALGLNVPYHQNPNLPAYNTEALISFYKQKENLFNKRSFLSKIWGHKYSSHTLEPALKDFFGGFFLKEAIGHVIIPTYEVRQERVYFFDSQKAQMSSADDFYMHDIARAASAAPTYFEAAEIKSHNLDKHLFVDGGLVCNDPTLTAFLKAQTIFPNVQKINLLSLGTGRTSLDNLSSLRGVLRWGVNIYPLVTNGISDLNDRMIRELVAQQYQKINYVRLQPNLAKKRHKMDNIDDDNVEYLLAISRKMIEQHASILDEVTIGLANAYEKKGYLLYPETRTTQRFEEEVYRLRIKLSNNEINQVQAWDEMYTFLNSISVVEFTKQNQEKTINLKEGINLSTREAQILALLGKNMTIKQIAITLCISLRTVEAHLNMVRIKTGCLTNAELVRFFHRTEYTSK